MIIIGKKIDGSAFHINFKKHRKCKTSKYSDLLSLRLPDNLHVFSIKKPALDLDEIGNHTETVLQIKPPLQPHYERRTM